MFQEKVRKWKFWLFVILIAGLFAAESILAGSIASDKAKQMAIFDELNWIIPLGTYEQIFPLAGQEDAYIVKQDGKYGFLTEQGLIACRYDEIKAAGLQGEGLYPARIGKKWGYIDQDGAEVIGMAYSEAEPFAGAYAAVEQDGVSLVIDRLGKVCCQSSEGRFLQTGKEGYFHLMKEKGWGPLILAATGKEAAGGRNFERLDYSEGFWCADPIQEDGTEMEEGGVVYLDGSFQQVYGPFLEGYPFSEGLAKVVQDEAWESYYIDRNGDPVIGPLPEGDWINEGRFSEGVAFFGAGEKTGKLIDQKGETLAKVTADAPLDAEIMPDDSDAVFTEGWLALSKGGNGAIGFVDRKGNWVVPPVFDQVCSLTDGRASVRFSGMWGVIGKEVRHGK